MANDTKRHLPLNPLEAVYRYHDTTKHRRERSARSAGYMDWDTQPNPFRSFSSTESLPLPLPELRFQPTYDELFTSQLPLSLTPFSPESISEFFYFSMALSAWKQTSSRLGKILSRWSLRVNPSSGNLHPTEAYLVTGSIAGLNTKPSVFHYAPLKHELELRAVLPDEAWQKMSTSTKPFFLVGLTSIHWRESWKYGERAFRYCQHDVGHALAALGFSAACLGWRAKVLTNVQTADIETLLGTNLQEGIEREHSDCFVLVSPNKEEACFSLPAISAVALRELAGKASFQGEPNILSPGYLHWEVIDEVEEASRKKAFSFEKASPSRKSSVPLSSSLARPHSAHTLIRQRRSAVRMDSGTFMQKNDFYALLKRLLPGGLPFSLMHWPPQVSLLFFIHRVHGLEPGLYFLERNKADSLRKSADKSFLWQQLDDCPADIPFFLLSHGDLRDTAMALSCSQEIAGESAFSLAMLAEFETALKSYGPGAYPCLFWETGVIGQLLYLEAEAAGLKGTGIGCFLDDEVHRVLGIKNHCWQSLYHFTIGKGLDDSRIQSIEAYAHLNSA